MKHEGTSFQYPHYVVAVASSPASLGRDKASLFGSCANVPLRVLLTNKSFLNVIYFKTCSSVDEVKAMYKTLAKKFHPDCGGDTATMQTINVEYALACARLIKGENLTAEDKDERVRLSEEYRAVIEKLCALEGIIIEVVGQWLWVTGLTFPVRKQLKEAGLYFASKKAAWYYRADEYATKGGKKTLDEIRAKYGSERVNARKHGKALASTY